MSNASQPEGECGRCGPLQRHADIRSPGNLVRVLQTVQEEVANGTLAEMPWNSPWCYEPFASVNAAGPWDDILSYRFRCMFCGHSFTLKAETYHGSGGAWQPVKSF